MDLKLKNKRILVTGFSYDISQAIAFALAQEEFWSDDETTASLKNNALRVGERLAKL